jgi:hypothetical protein
MTHRNIAGFLTLPLAAYGAIAALLLIGGLAAWGAFEKSRYDTLKQEYEQFKGGLKALGEAAKKAAAEREAQDKANKEKADALHQAAVDQLNADIRRLRDSRSRGGGLSSPAPAPGSVAGTCFDPALLAGALRRLDEGSLGLVAEGAKAVTDLDGAKTWAQKR